MAGEITAARGKIKTKLDITDTTFDTILSDCIEQAIPRLAAWFQYYIAADTSVTMAVDADSFTLPVSTSTLLRLYGRTSSTDVWREIDLWRQHRGTVYINEPISYATSLKILASRPFTYLDADLALLAVDYPEAMLVLYYFAMSEFATYLVGDKRKFNLYIQSSGVRTVDEMKDLATFYENRAVRMAEDAISSEGL